MSTNKRVFDNTPDDQKFYGFVLPNIASYNSIADAFMDLIDNSFDAGATNVTLDILENDNKDIIGYCIIDNGLGMNEKTLEESFTFAGPSVHKPGDYGKFGAGGTTACFTYANKKTTFTKQKNGKLLVAELDLRQSTKPYHRDPNKSETKYFEKNCPHQGTMVVMGALKPEKIEYKRAGDLKNSLVKNFGTFFHERLQAKDIINVRLPLRKETFKVEPTDPLLWDRKDILENYYEKTVPFKEYKIKIRFSSVKNSMLKEKEKSYDYQGIYVSRNNRLIKDGGPLKGLWNKIETQLNEGRVHIYFDDSLDNDIGINVAKNKIILSQELIDALKDEINNFKQSIRSKYRKTSNSQEVEILQKEEQAFLKEVESHSSPLKIPSSTKEIEVPIKRNKKDDGKKGGVKPKNTDITRKQRIKKKIIPEFRHVIAPGGSAFWYEFEEGNMVININDSHSFINKYYSKSNDIGKEAMRKIWLANCLVQHEYYDEDDYDLIDTFSLRILQKIDVIEKLFK